eukprot:scaffold128053_cov13-Tisochrysis_lutea.AAC.1
MSLTPEVQAATQQQELTAAEAARANATPTVRPGCNFAWSQRHNLLVGPCPAVSPCWHSL